jgi:hypothetical protein
MFIIYLFSCEPLMNDLLLLILSAYSHGTLNACGFILHFSTAGPKSIYICKGPLVRVWGFARVIFKTAGATSLDSDVNGISSYDINLAENVPTCAICGNIILVVPFIGEAMDGMVTPIRVKKLQFKRWGLK